MRQIEREKTLPAFSCDVDEFGQLIAAIQSHFTSPTLTSIALAYEKETSSYSSTGEIHDALYLPSSVSDLHLMIWSNEGPRRQISLTIDTMIGRVKLRATSDSTAWNAGATEIALDFARRHRLWYGSWRWLAWLLLLGMFLVVLITTSRYVALPLWLRGVMFSMIGLIATAAAIWVGPRILPACQLVIRREKESWLKSHTTELTLSLSFIAIVTSALAWLFPRTLH